jgi:hypothetical protein
MLTDEKVIDLAIKSMRKQMKNKPGGGYKVNGEKVKYIDIIKHLEKLKESLKRPIHNKCKNCQNFAGRLDGTGYCFPKDDNLTCARKWDDGCTALFNPRKGKNILDEVKKNV